MRRTLLDSTGLWFTGLSQLLMAFPVLLAVHAFAGPGTGSIAWLWGLPVLLYAAILVRMLTDIRLRLAQVAIAIAGGILYGTALADSGNLFITAVQSSAAMLVVHRGFVLPSSMKASIPAEKYWTAFAVYLFAFVVYHNVAVLKPYLPLLNAAGLLLAVTALYAMNTLHLRETVFARNSTGRLPRNILRHNYVFVSTVVAGVLLAAFGLTFYWGDSVWAGVRGALQWLFSLGTAETGERLQPPPPPPEPLKFGTGEAREHNTLLYRLLTIFFNTVLILGALAALALVIRALSKNTPVLLRKLGAWLSRLLQRSAPVTEEKDYTDEVTDLSFWDDFKNKGLGDWLKPLMTVWKKERLEDYKENRDRIRYLYRSWIGGRVGRGYSVKSHLTPAETREDMQRWTAHSAGKRESLREDEGAADTLVGLYYKARYSGADITEGEVEQAKSAVRKR